MAAEGGEAVDWAAMVVEGTAVAGTAARAAPDTAAEKAPGTVAALDSVENQAYEVH